MCNYSDSIILKARVNEDIVLPKESTKSCMINLFLLHILGLQDETEDVSFNISNWFNIGDLVGECCSKELSIVMIILKPLLPVLKTNESTSSKYTNLSHLTAEHFP